MAEKNYIIGPGTMALAVVFIIVLTAGLTYYITKGQAPAGNQTNYSSMSTITVRGEAARTVTPDLLTIGVTVETTGADASAAQAENARQVDRLKAALLANGVKENELETSSYYTYPVYNDSCYRCPTQYYNPYYPRGYPAGDVMEAGAVADGVAESGVAVPDYPPSIDYYPIPSSYPCGNPEGCTIIGYKTVHSLAVKTGKINDSSGVMGAMLGVSNTSIDYIYFSLKEETRILVEGELQGAAALNARTKAANIASGLGSSLGRLVSVNTEGYPYYPYPLYAYQKDAYGGAEASVPPTEVFPTDLTMSNSVVAVYELAQ